MINNRQAGRRRGRGNNGGNGGGGNGPRQGGQGRSDNGNRIDNRARGNASQLYEKYKNMAADSQRQGDRVTTEYYLQFADHYFRVLSDQRGRFEDQPQRRQQFDADMDGDEEYGDEGEPIRASEQTEAPRQERQERDGRRDQREPRSNEARPNEPRPNDRQAEQRDRGNDRPRRWDRDERPARPVEAEAGAGAEVGGQHRADPVAPGEDLAARAETVIAADAPLAVEAAPRRRGRPRREPVPAADAQLPESNGFEADRLPPALGIAAANDAGDDGEAPKPRRRRVRTAVVGDVAAD